MPSYQQQRAGTWKAIVRVTGHSVKTKTFRLKKQAIEWAESLEDELRRPQEQLTAFSDVWSLYYPDVSKRIKRPDSELKHWTLLSGWLSGFTMETLQAPDITAFINKRLLKVSSATVRKDILFISRFYNFAIRDLHLPLANPVANVRLPSCSPHRQRVATKGELMKLLDNVSENMRPLFQLALETAMRRGELVALSWQHVYLQERVVRLPSTLTKNGYDREVPLSSRAVSILQGLKPRLHGSVFNVSINGVSSAMLRGCQRANIRDLRFHDLRHTAITNYARKGLSTAQLQGACK